MDATYGALSWSACHTFSAVNGVSKCRIPVWEIASITAFTTAGGAARVGSSPMPFIPKPVMGEGVSMVSKVNAGILSALGNA